MIELILIINLWLGGYSGTPNHILSQSAPVEENSILQYQAFLREEARDHRDFLENSFDKLITLFSGIVILGGAIITWMNYRTKNEITEAVKKQFNSKVDQCIQNQLKEVQDEIDSTMKDFRSRSSLVEHIIMELSARENTEISKTAIGNHKLSAGNKPGRKAQAKKILWVDDNPNNNYYIIQLLDKYGIITTTVTTTDDAIKQLQKDNYDLVISDMDRNNIPDDGLILLRQIHKDYPKIPVVFFTSAYSISQYAHIAYSNGAAYMTDKTSNLLGRIQQLLEI